MKQSIYLLLLLSVGHAFCSSEDKNHIEMSTYVRKATIILKRIQNVDAGNHITVAVSSSYNAKGERLSEAIADLYAGDELDLEVPLADNLEDAKKQHRTHGKNGCFYLWASSDTQIVAYKLGREKGTGDPTVYSIQNIAKGKLDEPNPVINLCAEYHSKGKWAFRDLTPSCVVPQQRVNREKVEQKVMHYPPQNISSTTMQNSSVFGFCPRCRKPWTQNHHC